MYAASAWAIGQPLVGQPPGRRLAAMVLAGDRDGQPVHRGERRHGPVRSEADPRPERLQRPDRVLQRRSLGPEPRDGELLHAVVEARPQGLEVGDDAEIDEPLAVGHGHELGVGDDGAPVARARSGAPRASIASSAIRTPPSPMAWMWIWKPSASNAARPRPGPRATSSAARSSPGRRRRARAGSRCRPRSRRRRRTSRCAR